MTAATFILRLTVAILLGSVIGVERQWRQRFAGLRTNALVAAGAALFTSISQMIPTDGDQSKIPSYIVSGIGFLGAGVIMKEGPTVRGLNTAATVWCSAAVGVLVGFGFFEHGLLGAAGILATNVLLRPLARKLYRESKELVEQELRYRVTVTCRQHDEAHVRFVILQSAAKGQLVLHSLKSEDLSTERNEVIAELDSFGRNDSYLESIVSHLSMERGVSAVAWSVLGQSLAAEA